MPRTAWILLSVGLLAFFLAVLGASVFLKNDSDPEVPSVETAALGQRRLELPLARSSGALLVAKHRGPVLVGVAEEGSRLEVVVVDGEASVASQDLSFRIDGRAVDVIPCGYACSRLERTGGERLVVAVRGSTRLHFDIGNGAPNGRRLFSKMTTTMKSLRSYRYVETLTSGNGDGARSIFEVRPPDRARFRTADGYRSVIIRNSRWDSSGGTWERSPFPRFRATYMWDGADHPRILRDRGRVAVLTLFDRDPIAAWFELHVEKKTGRVLQANMVAPSHFMVQRFSSFNTPLTIKPPR